MSTATLPERFVHLTTGLARSDRAPNAPTFLDLALVDRDDHGFEISVLGAFAFRCGYRALTLTGGSRRLLALLALREQPMTRALAGYTLWPDASEPEGACRMRSALCRLKNRVGDVVEIAGPDLQLRPEVAVDLRASRALVRGMLDRPKTTLSGQNASAMVRMLSGDLLPGWRDEWVLADSNEWHQLRLHALEAVAAHLAADGRCADATAAALAAVRSEPLRESAHGALIKTFLASGNQGEALDQFDRFRAVLRAKLGVEPSPRLWGLVGDLRRRSR